jgi:hypothetical protein
MGNLLVSLVRFSAAMTLYGFEQIQSTMNVTRGGQNFSNIVDKLGLTIDSMTDVLANEVDQKKQDTLKSVGDTMQEVVSKSFSGTNILDPRQVFRATNALFRKAADVVTNKQARTTGDSQPKPAAEVMP